MAFRGLRARRGPAAGPGYPAAPDQGAYGNEVPPGLLKPRNGAGRAALLLGVLALICAIGFFFLITLPLAVLFGLAAVILGSMGRSRVRKGIATNRGSATTGIVTGLLSLLLIAGLVAGGVALFNANRNNPDATALRDCARSAGFDLQAQRDCVDQYRNNTGN
jgi:hypothetical protein